MSPAVGFGPLSAAERLVLGLLWREKGADGGVTISLGEVASLLGWKRRDTARQVVRSLEKRGLVRVKGSGVDDSGRTTPRTYYPRAGTA